MRRSAGKREEGIHFEVMSQAKTCLPKVLPMEGCRLQSKTVDGRRKGKGDES